jgi:hypothetical protein
MPANEQAKQKPKRGRPKKFVDLELVEKLAHIQCTHSEIASTLGVSVDTLTRNRHFAETYKRGAEGGRKSLRRMQFESANKGNVTMMIWLGKQYLGQSDQHTTEIRQLPSLRDLTTDELAGLLSEYAQADPRLAAEIAAIDAEFVVEPMPAAQPAVLLATPAGGSADSSPEAR